MIIFGIVLLLVMIAAVMDVAHRESEYEEFKERMKEDDRKRIENAGR